MKYYSAIKKYETGSFVEMWTDLETVIESEEKNKYRILSRNRDTVLENKCMDTKEGRRSRMNGRLGFTYIHY